MTTRAMIEFVSKAGGDAIFTEYPHVWTRVLNRFEMFVHCDDKSVSPHLISDGFWESWITKWVMDNVGPGDLFLDVGANTGYYSFLAHNLGASVIAYEPNHIYWNMIVESQSRNKMKFPVHEIALSNYNGEASLNIPEDFHGSGSLNQIVPGYEITKINVQVRQLDEVFEPINNQRVIVKIDAEGEEERILEGAKRFLDRTGEVVLLLEYTPGVYSAGFVDHLFDNWHVYAIDGAGEEREIVPDFLGAQNDWAMLVLR